MEFRIRTLLISGSLVGFLLPWLAFFTLTNEDIRTVTSRHERSVPTQRIQLDIQNTHYLSRLQDSGNFASVVVQVDITSTDAINAINATWGRNVDELILNTNGTLNSGIYEILINLYFKLVNTS